MANLGMDFNAAEVEPTAPREAIPAGKYPGHIIETEVKDTNGGTGSYLAVTAEILDGPHKGHKLYANLNLWNANDQAREIAHRELSAICHATGQMRVQDSEQLHFKPMVITVKMIPAGTVDKGKNGKPDYVHKSDKNEIGGWEHVNNAKPVTHAAAPPRTAPQTTTGAPAQAPSQASPAAPAASGSKTPPWARKAA